MFCSKREPWKELEVMQCGRWGKKSKLKTSAERGVPNAVHALGASSAGFVRNLDVRLSNFCVINEVRRYILLTGPHKIASFWIQVSARKILFVRNFRCNSDTSGTE